MEIKCINVKCLWIWDYRGKSNSYICCPKCLYRFKIQRGITNYSENMLSKDNIIDNIHNNITNIHSKKPQVKHIHLFNLSDLKKEDAEEEKDYIKIIELPQKTPLQIYEHQASFF